MKKGNVAAFLVVTVIAAVIGVVVLAGIIEPLTSYTDTTSELMNLTGNGYLKPNISPLSGVAVYNDTNCTDNKLVENIDYLIDRPYNGDITGATPSNGGLSFVDGDKVVVPITGTKADLTGNITIIGFVKPIKL